MEIQIQKPIFILGSGRSGTTLLYNLLSVHPDLCWFSNITDAHVSLPQLAYLHRVLDIPLVGQFVKKHITDSTSIDRILYPSEGINIYHAYAGFARDRKTTSGDAFLESSKKLKHSIAAHMMATGKQRFISKQNANTQRIGLLRDLFPDAYFIHIIRDGRAVAYSLSRTDWWPSIQLWWSYGQRPEEKWKDYNAVVHCAAHWQHNVDEILRNKKLLRSHYIEVRYEELVKNVRGSLLRILKCCDLRSPNGYLASFPKSFPVMNYKWRKELSGREQKTLNKILSRQLHALGYPIP